VNTNNEKTNIEQLISISEQILTKRKAKETKAKFHFPNKNKKFKL
jgi:hypothetical protein